MIIYKYTDVAGNDVTIQYHNQHLYITIADQSGHTNDIAIDDVHVPELIKYLTKFN